MKLTRYNYHTLMIKDMSQMMEFIPWLIFIKIVIISNNNNKKIVIINKDL